MKKHLLHILLFSGLISITQLVSSKPMAGGKQSATKAPAESPKATTNDPWEHGAITIASFPSMNNGHYAPGTKYQLNVTIKEKEKTRFGFYVEIHDNSGPLATTSQRSPVGSVTITDPVNTQTYPAKRSGGIAVSQTDNGGAVKDEVTFTFDWTAPDNGIVNFEIGGTAGDIKDVEQASDNVYSKHLQYTPATPVVIQSQNMPVIFEILPVPAQDFANLSADAKADKDLAIGLYKEDGVLVKTAVMSSTELEKSDWRFSMEGIEKGIYLMTISGEKTSLTKKVSVK